MRARYRLFETLRQEMANTFTVEAKRNVLATMFTAHSQLRSTRTFWETETKKSATPSRIQAISCITVAL